MTCLIFTFLTFWPQFSAAFKRESIFAGPQWERTTISSTSNVTALVAMPPITTAEFGQQDIVPELISVTEKTVTVVNTTTCTTSLTTVVKTTTKLMTIMETINFLQNFESVEPQNIFPALRRLGRKLLARRAVMKTSSGDGH